MEKFKLNNMYKGWFIGDFEPSVLKSDNFEMQYVKLKDNFSEEPYYYRLSTRIILIVSGTIRTFDKKEFIKDDIIVFHPGEMASIESVGESIILSIRYPGNLSDKIFGIVSQSDTDDDFSKAGNSRIASEQWLQLLDYLIMLSKMKQTQIVEGTMTQADYMKMQKEAYENPEKDSKNDIVGYYNWHEKYPYETFLLYHNGDVRSPIFDDFSDKKALDFACGPGRMVKRMKNFFEKVDGCDISAKLIREAKEYVEDAEFYVTNGNDLGDVPLNYYDYIYCTISMQHIASYQVRKQILQNMHEALKKGGKIVLQMAFNPDFPFSREIKKFDIEETGIRVKILGCGNEAGWFENHFNASATNGSHDVGLGTNDIDSLKEDIGDVFENVKVWYSDVKNYYDDLEGEKHVMYWASHWIYIYGEKN